MLISISVGLLGPAKTGSPEPCYTWVSWALLYLGVLGPAITGSPGPCYTWVSWALLYLGILNH
jgi:hypothetical protein